MVGGLNKKDFTGNMGIFLASIDLAKKGEGGEYGAGEENKDDAFRVRRERGGETHGSQILEPDRHESERLRERRWKKKALKLKVEARGRRSGQSRRRWSGAWGRLKPRSKGGGEFEGPEKVKHGREEFVVGGRRHSKKSFPSNWKVRGGWGVAAWNAGCREMENWNQ